MFWQNVSEFIKGYDLSITVKKNDNDTLTLLFVPKPISEKENKDKSLFIPLAITGSPKELDSKELVDKLKVAFRATKDSIDNINLYQSGLVKAEKDKKDKIEKTTGKTTGKKSEDKKQTKLI